MKRYLKAYKLLASNTLISFFGFVVIANINHCYTSGDISGFLNIAAFGLLHISVVIFIGLIKKKINLELLSHLALLTMLQLTGWAFFSENIKNIITTLIE